MMRIILLLLSVVLSFSLITVTSCKKAQEETPKPVVEETTAPEVTQPQETQPAAPDESVPEEAPAKEEPAETK